MTLDYQDLLGCEFKEHGRGEDRKYDCYGLSMAVLKRVGIELPEFEYVIRHELINNLINKEKESITVKIEKPEPYCLIIFKTHPLFSDHFGVVLDDCKSFIHIRRNSTVCVQRLSDEKWKRLVLEFRKVREKEVDGK